MNMIEKPDVHALEPFHEEANTRAILDNISLFGGLTESQLEKVFSQLQQVHYQPGEYIFRQGDHPSYIYIVLRGHVRLVFDAQTHPYSLNEFKPGDCFGETALIGIQNHSGSTRAQDQVELLVLSKEVLMELFESDKDLFSRMILNIAREASRRLHQTDALFLHYIHDHDQ